MNVSLQTDTAVNLDKCILYDKSGMRNGNELNMLSL